MIELGYPLWEIDMSTWWLIGYIIFMVVAIILIVSENRDPASTLAWLLVLWLLPVVGILFYIFFGRNWRVHSKAKIIAKQKISEELKKVMRPLFKEEKEVIKKIKNTDNTYRTKKLLQLLEKDFNTLITDQNRVTVLQGGKEKFERLFQDIKQAKRFIHMEYFIWQADKITEKVVSLLTDKVKEGVEVKIILDPTGWLLFNKSTKTALGDLLRKAKQVRRMRRAGIKVVYFFNALSAFKITTINYPLHRKIVVVDGQVAYTGGINMGAEYLGETSKFDIWRDTHLRLEGESVLLLQSMFAENWNQVTGEGDLFRKKYFPPTKVEGENLPIQMIASGPDSKWDTIRQMFFSMIMLAQKKVYIQSPYFIPDASVYEALKVAALSGVDVRVMMAGEPDKKIPYWTAHTYFEELLTAGVKIYQYQGGFMHCKTLNIDSEVCTIGTTNLDIRSFHIGFEVNAFIFSGKVAGDLEKDFMNDLKNCHQFTLEDYAKISRTEKLRNSLVRLLAPLL